MNNRYDFDVIIVGSGVVGALLAYKLSSSKNVLVLEAGPKSNRERFVKSYASAVVKIPSSPYQHKLEKNAPYPKVLDKYDQGVYKQKTPSTPFKSTYERVVGGSTWHWLGNVPRLVPSDFKMKSQYNVAEDWPIAYDDLEPFYVQAEKELGVSGDHDEWNGLLGGYRSEPFPMEGIRHAYGDLQIKSKLDGALINNKNIKVRKTPQARNSTTYQGRPPCAGNSSCVPICPIGAKYDATIHVDLAKIRGATIRHCCKVTKLIEGASGTITSIQYIDWTNPDSPIKNNVTGKTVIVAAHAIESPLLFMRSKIASNLPVGQYLMDHLQGYGGAMLPSPVFPFRGPPVTGGIDEFRDGGFRSIHAAFRISVGNDGWGRMESPDKLLRAKIFEDNLIGKELVQAINSRITKLVRFSYSTEMLPEKKNRVELGPDDKHGNSTANIYFSLPKYNEDAFVVAKEIFMQMFNKLGALETTFSYPKKNFSGAGHIMGTMRMGSEPVTSVVDSTCRVHNYNNLYVAGASVFTTSGTANPTLTAAALALRLGEHLLSQEAS